MMNKITKNNSVKVIAGKDKNCITKVIKVRKNKVLLENVNKKNRYLKTNKHNKNDNKTTLYLKESWIDISNIKKIE